jgi:hypothetical protein
MTLIIRESNGTVRELDVTQDTHLISTQGAQYYIVGADNYTFNLVSDNQTINAYFLDRNGESFNLTFHNLAQYIQQNDPLDPFSIDSAFAVSTNQAGDDQIHKALSSDMQPGELIEYLKSVLDESTPASGAVIDDFQGLLDNLDAAASGELLSTAYLALDTDSDIEPQTPKLPDQARPESPDSLSLSSEASDSSYIPATLVEEPVAFAEPILDPTPAEPVSVQPDPEPAIVSDPILVPEPIEVTQPDPTLEPVPETVEPAIPTPVIQPELVEPEVITPVEPEPVEVPAPTPEPEPEIVVPEPEKPVAVEPEPVPATDILDDPIEGTVIIKTQVIDEQATTEAGIYLNPQGEYVTLERTLVDTPTKEVLHEATYKTIVEEVESTIKVPTEVTRTEEVPVERTILVDKEVTNTGTREVEVEFTNYRTETEIYTENIEIDKVRAEQEYVDTTYKTITEEFTNTREVVITDITELPNPITTNAVVTLDISGSMTNNSEGVDRIALAKEALTEMVNTYESMGGVNTKIVTFGTGADSTDWMSAEDALDFIENIKNGGWTNYEEAVKETYTNFDAPQADQTIAYFISDGEPTKENKEGRDQRGNEGQDSEDGWLDQQYIDGWDAFETEVDNTHIVALGDGITDLTYLDMLAASHGVETKVVVDSKELTTIIRETSRTIVEEFTDTREVEVVDVPGHYTYIEYPYTELVPTEFTREVQVPFTDTKIELEEYTYTETVQEPETIVEYETNTYTETAYQDETITELVPTEVIDTPAYTETVIDYDTITSLNLVNIDDKYYSETEVPTDPIMQDLVQTRELDVPLDSLLDLEGSQEYVVMDSEGHTIDLDEHTFTSQGSTSIDDSTFTHYTSNNIDIYVEDSIDDII